MTHEDPEKLFDFGNLYVATGIIATSTSTIIGMLAIFTLVRVFRNGSFRFLRFNLYCIILNSVLDVGFIFQLGFSYHYQPEKEWARILYNTLYVILKSLQYITLNVVLWNVTFKYWVTSSQVVRIVQTLNQNIGVSDSVADRSNLILKH